MDRWPEGPAADPEAARERYDSDMRASRKALRETVRADLPAAHFGLGLVIVASVIVGMLAGPVAGVLVAGAFAALFLVALGVLLLRGPRGLDAGRRAYLFTFGWANWVQRSMENHCGGCHRLALLMTSGPRPGRARGPGRWRARANARDPGAATRACLRRVD